MRIGIDIVSIQRIDKLKERFGQKALKRFLNDDEIKIAKTPQSIAGFWAAKEALSKALGTGIGKECNFSDIFIHKTKNGAPMMSLNQKILDEFHINNISLSISHDGGFAIAVVALT